MAKIILTVDGSVLNEMPLTKARSTIGRRSNNDLVIDHVAISGEHAAIVALNDDFFLEDLDSTNGTQVNGQPIKKHFLRDNDVINLTPYMIRFVAGGTTDGTNLDQGDENGIGQSDELLAETQFVDSNISQQKFAIIKVLSGPSKGKEVMLTKALTTIGRPGVQVAVITHRKQGYFITHIEGAVFPLVNGHSIGSNARQLKFDDVIDLSGTQMAFSRVH